ncbi:hypothetical protein HDU91_006177 [Kappamyces sp. JEL0680]|nr:hypothetical protein HDU91_006177 [Kappamyces sp. JEL0680]
MLVLGSVSLLLFSSAVGADTVQAQDCFRLALALADMNLAGWGGLVNSTACCQNPFLVSGLAFTCDGRGRITTLELSGLGSRGTKGQRLSPHLGLLDGLVHLKISDCGVVGVIPDGSLPASLERLDLDNNALEGAVPASLGSLVNLQVL